MNATVEDGTQENLRFPAMAVRAFARALLSAAGTRPDVAELAADGLWHASLRGTDSHGIRLLPHYIAGLRSGRINPSPRFSFERTSAATGMLDADHGFGHAAGVGAMDHAMELAGESGIGLVAARRSSHCGAMSYFGLRAAERDMIGLAFTHATARVRSYNGRASFFGTNPICFTAPIEGEEPLCFDSAPTLFSFNKVRQFAEAGQILPEGVAADENGGLTCDARAATQLLPIGLYKGFGLTLIVDVLCALLSGMPYGPHVSSMFGADLSARRNLGQLFGAIRIDAFEQPAQFKKRLRVMAEELRAQQPLSAEAPVLMPGDPEKQCSRERLRDGIPFTAIDIERLDVLAEELNLPPLGEWPR